jgi:hypothetical protein
VAFDVLYMVRAQHCSASHESPDVKAVTIFAACQLQHGVSLGVWYVCGGRHGIHDTIPTFGFGAVYVNHASEFYHGALRYSNLDALHNACPLGAGAILWRPRV